MNLVIKRPLRSATQPEPALISAALEKLNFLKLKIQVQVEEEIKNLEFKIENFYDNLKIEYDQDLKLIKLVDEEDQVQFSFLVSSFVGHIFVANKIKPINADVFPHKVVAIFEARERIEKD